VAISVVVNLLKFSYQIARNLRLTWVRRQARLKYLEDLEKSRQAPPPNPPSEDLYLQSMEEVKSHDDSGMRKYLANWTA